MNNDHFMRGLERAFERRTKAKQQQSNVQHMISNDSGTSITTNTSKVTSTNSIASLDFDEQYRITIIQKMLNHIKQKRN